MKRNHFRILVAAALLASCVKDRAVGPRRPRIGIAYPGITHAADRERVAPYVRDLGVRHIRFDESWEYRERVPGRYNWKPLDERIRFAQELGLKVFLQIPARGPAWALGVPRNPRGAVFSRPEAFTRYAEALAKRHGRNLHAVQFGNEWQIRYWYPGSAYQFLDAHNRLARAFREHSPDTAIALGGFSIDVLRTLSALDGNDTPLYDRRGRSMSAEQRREYLDSVFVRHMRDRVRRVVEGADFDLLDAHLYADAEHWPAYLGTLRGLVPGKPVVVTEFGGPDLRREPSNPAYMARRVAVYLETLEATGVEEAYFFRLQRTPTMSPSHAASWLVGPAGPRPAYYVIRDWNVSDAP